MKITNNNVGFGGLKIKDKTSYQILSKMPADYKICCNIEDTFARIDEFCGEDDFYLTAQKDKWNKMGVRIKIQDADGFVMGDSADLFKGNRRCALVKKRESACDTLLDNLYCSFVSCFSLYDAEKRFDKFLDKFSESGNPDGLTIKDEQTKRALKDLICSGKNNKRTDAHALRNVCTGLDELNTCTKNYEPMVLTVLQDKKANQTSFAIKTKEGVIVAQAVNNNDSANVIEELKESFDPLKTKYSGEYARKVVYGAKTRDFLMDNFVSKNQKGGSNEGK